MKAILLRELRSYFNSTLIYIVISVFLVISAILYMLYNMMTGNPELLNMYYNLNTIFLFLVPMITMKLFSEEKSQKTDQLLLTSPNTITSIVLGKYFSALIVFMVILAFSFVYAIITAAFTNFDFVSYFVLLLGELLIGASFISVGLFVSSVIGNMVTSAFVTFGVLMVTYYSDMIPQLFGNPKLLTTIFGFFSLSRRFDNFGIGLLGIDSIIYYLSFATIFIFLTIRAIDKRRWS